MPRSSPAPIDLRYGAHPDQRVDCRAAEAPGPARGLVLLVHGGYWRARLTAELMEPLAQSLRAHGWATANIEYRRGREASAWPEPLEDTNAAFAAVLDGEWGAAVPGPRVSLGHSVGGQLALLTRVPVDAAVALAPVTDLARTLAEGLGEDAVREYFGRGEPLGTVLSGASPLGRPLRARRALVVHGDADVRVPPAHSRAYAEAARGRGERAELVEHAGLGHRELIDPAEAHWPGVLEWMGRV